MLITQGELALQRASLESYQGRSLTKVGNEITEVRKIT